MTNLIALTQTGANWLLAVLIIVVVAQLLAVICLILAHYKKLGVVLNAVKNWFVGVGRAIKNFFVKLGKGTARRFREFHERFVDGSVGTKLSHFIMGSGNFYHKQICKGILFLVFQLLFIAFMALSPAINDTPLGGQALVNLVTLGKHDVAGGIDPTTHRPVKIDNSMLMLLFGVVTLGIIAIYVFVWLANIASSYKADLDQRYGGGPTSFKTDLKSMLDTNFHKTMLAPTILGVTVFTILPTLYMILIAFTNYGGDNAVGQVHFNWVGFDNFVEMFTNPNGEIAARFGSVLLWTVIWAFFATFTNYFGGIFLAILINRKGIKGKVLFRTVFIMTIAIPQFISLLAIRNLLATSGPVNGMLMSMGLIKEPINFLGLNPNSPVNEYFVKMMIILINMWVGVPYTMLMTSGILMNIPTDLYEAAKVDGAKPLKIFFKITFPYIFFITTPYLISSFIGNVTSFNIIFMLTGGGPTVAGYKAGKTDLLVTWLYKLTIDNNEYSTGAVIGILTFICTSVLTLVTYRRSKSYKEEDTFQ